MPKKPKITRELDALLKEHFEGVVREPLSPELEQLLRRLEEVPVQGMRKKATPS